ncbi:hypothetical protein GA0074692_2226 [Micromonospora pallida]|uniref:Uncharacterized protein n=1 Tax=Micromonospora pallida TaxID=145854 RepID=A0A1C6SBA4_9ACTN|nr:hypothetical protein [Micromonospora pallida]SCL26753.1 hypothetical protein GA0074692_2226 [Micromonospora pallida]
MPDQQWHAEANDEWLAERRSTVMAWLRRRFRVLGGVAGAVSHADTGPYAGAPRNPDLRVDNGDRSYATVRYTTGQIAYTTTHSSLDECEICGRPVAETQEITCMRGEQTHRRIGSVRACRNCAAESWLSRSRMPTASRARKRANRHVV